VLVAFRQAGIVLTVDLALGKGVQRVSWLDHLPSQLEVSAVAEKWQASRSLATSYLCSAAFGWPETPLTGLEETGRGAVPSPGADGS
jgi:3-methyladenine DNA glycosylase/8-oxoguanine DNA glycosylase